MLIFDFDGTIADTVGEALLIVNELAPKYGFPEVDSRMAEELRGLRTREAIHRVGIKPRLLPRLVAELKSELRSRIESIAPIAGMPQNLEALRVRGVPMGILTSNSRENVEIFLGKWNLLGCFSFLETGSPIFGKARLLRRILDQPAAARDSSRKGAIFVGDETRDISAARRVGIRAAAVCWGANSRAILESMKPDFLLEDPAQLLDIAG